MPKPKNIALIIRKPTPLQKQPKEVNFHILLPQRRVCPLPSFFRNPLPLPIMRLHTHLRGIRAILLRRGSRHARKVRKRTPQPMETDIDRDEMQPRGDAGVEPLAEETCFEGQAVAV